MFKTLVRKFKLLTVFVLIVVMITPPVTLTAQPHAIEPFYADSMRPGEMPHFHAQEQFLQAPDPHCPIEQAMIDELLHEQANLWMQEPSVRDALRFYELRTSNIAYSSLSEEDRHLVLQQLDIADAAFATASELFVMMERDGLLLPKSIDVMVIVSGGLFSYIEAKQLITSIPNMIERNTEIMRFERLIQNFDIPAEVRARNLMNNSFVHVDIDRIQPEFTTPGGLEVMLLPDRSTSPGGIEVMLSTTPGGLEVTLSPEHVEPSFDLARQMFLDGHGATEIQTAFALGAALDVEPEAFLLPRGVYRAQSAVTFAPLYNFSNHPEAHSINELSTNPPLTPTPQPPMSPRTAQIMPPAMDNPYDTALLAYTLGVSAEEVDDLIEYGIEILGINIQPMSAPPSDQEDIINNPFGLRFNANESVSLNTGAATYRTNVLSLPGRGGFGFSLDMVYNSADAYVQIPVRSYILIPPFCEICWFFLQSRHCVWGCQPDVYWPVADSVPGKNPHGLGLGWKFDLPYIYHNVLYVPGRGSFNLFGNTISDALEDMQLLHDNTFISGAHRSNRRLTILDGTEYFFYGGSTVSHIIGMRDRFGNTIRFEYERVTDSAFGIGSMLLLSRIIDSNGKYINLRYHGSGNDRTITITGPDGSSFNINIYAPNPVWHTWSSRLISIQNQVGAITTFMYDPVRVLFNAIIKDVPQHSLSVNTLLLRQVTYPSGAQLRFDYGWRTINMGFHGARHQYIVTSRELLNNGRSYQRATFSYLRDHTAFPQNVMRPPANHTYYTTVTQNNGLRTVYTFNYRHLNTQRRTYNVSNVLQSQQTIAYNSDRLPTSITLTEHRGGFSRNNTQRFYYNNFGQVTTAISPLAQGRGDARYRTITTYDNRFGLPTTTTFMPDANTTVRTVNRLSADGRRIVGTDIYENNVRMSRTDFVHDQFGNITEIREFPNATGSEFITTLFTIDRGTMPTSIRTTNVRDANNALVGGTGIVERRFTHDDMWRILSETDPMGYVTSWAYDGLGRVTQVAHPNGGFETYTYNDWANTLTHRTVLGATYTHQFDGLGNLLTITDPVGTVILRNIYDNRMRVTETQNAQGIASSQRTVFRYDMFDRVVSIMQLNPICNSMHLEDISFCDVLDASGNRRVFSTITGLDGIGPACSTQTFVIYDRFGRRIQEGTTGGRITTYTHDLAGRVVTEQSLGINNTFTHNIFGVTSVRNIEGNTSRNTYDSMGRLVSSSDFMGNTQRFTYDALGRLIRQDVPFERAGTATRYSTTLYFYDRNGNLTQSHNTINLPGATTAWSITTNTFRHNQLMSSQTGNGPLTEFTYDLAGNILTQRVGGAVNAATTTFTYNNRGQLIRTADALGQAETFTYDANGLLLTRTDRNGTLFRKTYDHMGRLVREEAVQNGVVVGHRRYDYTLSGALWRIWNDNHIITKYHDGQGRLIRQTETGGIVRTFAYNAANNITDERVYVNGARHYHNTYTFDIAQRVHTVSSNGQLLATYAYNANGSRIRTTLSNGPIGTVTEYTRNLAGLITRIHRMGGAAMSNYDYIYYLDGNISRVIERRGSIIIRTLTYTYDTARRLTREQETGLILSELNRIYGFDNRGNRTAMIAFTSSVMDVTESVMYTYDLNNRLLTESSAAGNPFTHTFTYDRNGNQLTKTSRNQTETRTYNAFNQLTRVTSPGRTSDYTYRADGLRHSKAINGVRTYHVWNRGNIILEQNAAGAVINRFERDARGQLIRSQHHGWYLHDARGSVVQRADVNRNVLYSYWYTAFGNEVRPNSANSSSSALENISHEDMNATLPAYFLAKISALQDEWIAADQAAQATYMQLGEATQSARAETGLNASSIETMDILMYDIHAMQAQSGVGSNNPFRFNAEYWDSHRGEYYLRARSYNPRTGRFSQPDPFFHVLNGNINDSPLNILQAGNLYMFVMHNPVMFVDPLGLNAILLTDTGMFGSGNYNVANPFGHTALAIQHSDGSWWVMDFRSPDANKANVSVMFAQLNPETIVFGTDGKSIEYGWFTFNGTAYDIRRYSNQVFIEGNFDASWDMAHGLMGTNPGFNLVAMNCAWLAIYVLNHSITGDPHAEVNRILWQYERVGAPWNRRWERLEFYDGSGFKRTIIPNQAANSIRRITGGTQTRLHQ